MDDVLFIAGADSVLQDGASAPSAPSAPSVGLEADNVVDFSAVVAAREPVAADVNAPPVGDICADVLSDGEPCFEAFLAGDDCGMIDALWAGGHIVHNAAKLSSD